MQGFDFYDLLSPQINYEPFHFGCRERKNKKNI